MVTNHILSHNQRCMYHTMKAVVQNWGRVVEDAVERNPWGKSSSDLLCRFPNTVGLHLTSGDAPLDTQNSSLNNGTNGLHNSWMNNDKSRAITPICGGTRLALIPSWCHVNKSNTPSSKRTRVAACSFKERQLKSVLRMTKHKRDTNTNKSGSSRLNFSKMWRHAMLPSAEELKWWLLSNAL